MSAPATISMPKITGFECHVMTPVGVIGGTKFNSGVGVGDFVQGDGRAILVTISDKDGFRRAAMMRLDKAEHLVVLLQEAIERGHTALRAARASAAK